MTRLHVTGVPGVAELLGKGVYAAVPETLPDALPGQHVVVVAGEPASGAAAALRLSACGRCVTLLTRETARGAGIPRELRRALRGRPNITMRHGTELSWAVGVDYLEAVVLRNVATGQIDVCNASALFIV